MRRSAELYIQREGIHNKPTLGSKLYNGMSSLFEDEVASTYYHTDLSLISRAFESLAAMEKDPEKRKHIAGCGGLAMAAGSIAANTYFHKFTQISKMPQEKMDYFYQHVALLPENEIDLVGLYDKLDVDGWKKSADPRRLARELRAQGKLDYNALADRTNQVLEDAMEEMQSEKGLAYSSFSREKFYASSMRAYSELIRTATPEEKRDPAFQKFRDSIFTLEMKFGKGGTHGDLNDMNETCRKLDEQVALQRQKKSGWFISSTETDEHRRMTIAQRKLQYKVMQLRGTPITDLPEDEIEALKATDLKKLLDKARSETYRYCCLKTDYGKNMTFRHTAGADRFNAAYHSLQTIDEIADACGLLSPGEKLLNEAKRDLMHDRDDKAWTRRNVEDFAAKAILGMTLGNGKKSFAEQEKYLNEEKLRQATDKIKADPAFRRMMQQEGALKIADKLITGHSALTNAFLKAKQSLELGNEQAGAEPVRNENRELNDPEQMSAEDKKKMWASNPLQL